MRKTIKLLLLLTLILTSQQNATACNYAPATLDTKAKWEVNPRVVFDVEFQDPILKQIALEVVDELNSELIDIQLEPVFGNTNFTKEQLDPTIRNNPNSIVVRLDEAFGGFAGNYAPEVNFGWVDLKKSDWLALRLGDNSRQQEAGVYYVMKNVLMHEILHALNIRHQIEPMEDLAPLSFKEKFVIRVRHRTKAVMDQYVSRHNFGLTETDKNAIYRLYGIPCDRNKVTIEIEGKSLNLTLVPAPGRGKVFKKYKKRASKNWGSKPRPGLESKINKYAASVGVFNNEAIAYVQSGVYMIKVRGIDGYQENETFKPDIEGGTPSLNGTFYVRYEKKQGVYTLTDNVRKASKIRIEGNQEISIGDE